MKNMPTHLRLHHLLFSSLYNRSTFSFGSPVKFCVYRFHDTMKKILTAVSLTLFKKKKKSTTYISLLNLVLHWNSFLKMQKRINSIEFINLRIRHLYRIVKQKESGPSLYLKRRWYTVFNPKAFTFLPSHLFTLLSCYSVCVLDLLLALHAEIPLYPITTFSKSHEILITVYWAFQHSWSLSIFI